MSSHSEIEVIDSHTAGEPTRVVIAGAPELGRGTMADRLKVFRERFDHFRSAIVNEPRGSDVLVGALVLKSELPDCVAGIIFFNNVGYLGMCGHGTIGIVETLKHLGRIDTGIVRLETPVGIVEAELLESGEVQVANVPSYRAVKGVCITIPEFGECVGDVAWGGNWFFLVEGLPIPLELSKVGKLTAVCESLRDAVQKAGYPEVDHVELFAEPSKSSSHSRNFVLCPGSAYDRSPCGTGLSAKLACLAADGKLAEGDRWVQESILGTEFVGQYRFADDGRQQILPKISGRAYVCAHSKLILKTEDPFCYGIRG